IMKSFVFLRFAESTFNCLPVRRSSCFALVAAASLMFGWQKIAMGQSDDFNDGNDTGWVHLDLGTGTQGFYPGANYSFPGDNLVGTAYRIAAPAPPDEQLGEGPARAFSY